MREILKAKLPEPGGGCNVERSRMGKVFNAVERPQLLPLPESLFPAFEEAPRTVHRDGYIELQRSYYSVPPEYVGRQVWARWESRLVRVFTRRCAPSSAKPASN